MQTTSPDQDLTRRIRTPQPSNITVRINVENLDEYVIALLAAKLTLAEIKVHEAEISLWAAQDKAAALETELRNVRDQATGYSWSYLGFYRGKTITLSESQLERINQALGNL